MIGRRLQTSKNGSSGSSQLAAALTMLGLTLAAPLAAQRHQRAAAPTQPPRQAVEWHYLGDLSLLPYLGEPHRLAQPGAPELGPPRPSLLGDVPPATPLRLDEVPSGIDRLAPLPVIWSGAANGGVGGADAERRAAAMAHVAATAGADLLRAAPTERAASELDACSD